MREQEAMELKLQQEAEDKAHQGNMARIEKKLAIINGEAPVEEKKVVKKPTTKKKSTAKKPVAKKKTTTKKATKKKTK